MIDGVECFHEIYKHTPSVEVVFFAGLENGFEEEGAVLASCSWSAPELLLSTTFGEEDLEACRDY